MLPAAVPRLPMLLSLLSLLLLLLSSFAAAQRNLVTNGGFETGSLAGWLTPLGTLDPIQGVTSLQVLESINGLPGPNGRAYDGQFSLGWDGPTLQSIQQQIRVQGSHQFILSFFVLYTDADLLSNFSVTAQFDATYNSSLSFPSSTLLTQANFPSPPPFYWTQFTATLTSPRGANSLNLTFLCSNPGYGSLLDTVSLYDQGPTSNLNASVTAPPPAPAIVANPPNNLILNGDFEAGTLFPWQSTAGDTPYPGQASTMTGAYNSIYITGESADPTTGYAVTCPQGFWCFEFGAPYASIPLLTTVAVSSGNNYTLSFWYNVLGGYSPTSGGGSQLACSYSWSSSPSVFTTLLNIVNATVTTNNTRFRRNLGAPPAGATSITIRFDGYSYPAINVIDYVQLTPSVATGNAAAGTQLLTNGDFEQGVVASSPGWYATPGLGLTASSTGLGPGGQSYNGYYAAAWPTDTSAYTLTQQVPVVAGATYLLSYFLFFMDADADAIFQCSVQYDSQSTPTVLTTNANFPTAPPFWWTQFTYTLVAPTGSGNVNITFTGSDPDYSFFLDAVTLTVGGSGVSFPAAPPAVGDSFPPGNLLVNGDFESGTLAPWRLPSGDTNQGLISTYGLGVWDFLQYDSSPACVQGYYCMIFGAPQATIPLVQTVSVSSSLSYTWSFYYTNYGGYVPDPNGSGGSLFAASYYWGSTNTTLNYVLNQVNLTTPIINQGVSIELGMPPAGATTLTVRFDGYSDPTYMVLDLVVLTAQGAGTSPSNLLVNGDFEVGGYGLEGVGAPDGYGYGGTLDGWQTPLGTFDATPWINSTILFVYNSNIGAGPNGNSYSGLSSLIIQGQNQHSISQSVLTFAGHQYVLSFFLMFQDADLAALFSATAQWNTASSGTVLMTQANFPTQPPFWWTQFVFTLVAPAGSSSLNLTLSGADIGYGYILDYVTLYDQGVAGATTTVTAPPPPPAVVPNPPGNLAINGDFELGTLWPWREAGGDNPYSQSFGAFQSIDFGYGSYPCPEGYWCAYLGAPYFSIPIIQTVNVTAGQSYTFSFMYVNYGGYSAAEYGEAGNYFAASYYYGSSGSATPTVVFSQTNVTTQIGQTLQFTIGPVPSGQSTLSLRFDGWSYDDFILLDYITLTAAGSSSSAIVPPPAAGVSSSSSTAGGAPVIVGGASSSSAAGGGGGGSSGLSGGAIAGIVIGSVVGALLLLCCLLFICMRAGKKADDGAKQHSRQLGETGETSMGVPSESSQVGHSELRSDEGVELQPHNSV